MAKNFDRLYKKNIATLIGKGKAKMERLVRKFEDAIHYQKAMQILKDEEVRG